MPNDLARRLRARIRREGPISFADFMEAALYDPDDGYYSRGARIGEGGDFVTSPSLTPAFAKAVARRFAAAESGLLWFGTSPRATAVAHGLSRPTPALPSSFHSRADRSRC